MPVPYHVQQYFGKLCYIKTIFKGIFDFSKVAVVLVYAGYAVCAVFYCMDTYSLYARHFCFQISRGCRFSNFIYYIGLPIYLVLRFTASKTTVTHNRHANQFSRKINVVFGTCVECRAD